MPKQVKSGASRKVAIVAGLRTPFVKSGTVFRTMSALDLAISVVSELISRYEFSHDLIERVVFGQVVVSPQLPNIAREISLGVGLPRQIDAYSVSRACATGTQALVEAAMAIAAGDIDVALCGGVDSLSRPPITYQDKVVEVLMQLQAAKDPWSKLRALLTLSPKDLLPQPPALREPSTGLTMGESAEQMAQQNHIDRASQDLFACASHHKAAAAWEKGIFKQEVMHVPVAPRYVQTIQQDNLVRPDTSTSKLAQLRPVFDKKYGSITAGNSSPLTDGAAVLLLMEEKRAKSLGYQPLAYVKSWAFAAVDPAWQLLMAPGVAIPKALQRANLTLADIDVIDMHEAFAAQVLSNIQALSSSAWQEKHVGTAQALGDIDMQKLNIYGGSISLGHPFAATGARQALTMANELNRRGGGHALISQCAAGGLGAALILER